MMHGNSSLIHFAIQNQKKSALFTFALIVFDEKYVTLSYKELNSWDF